MSDEDLQTGLAPEPTENVGAVSDTDMGENQEQNNQEAQPIDPEVAKQQAVQKRIDKITFEKMEERRKNQALQSQIDDMQSKIPQVQRPSVPDMPDSFDDNYDDQMKARDQAIQDAAFFDANERHIATQNEQLKNQRLEEQQKALTKTVQDYSSRAAAQNISEQELAVAGQTVNAYGIGEDIGGFILNDEHGPLITKYLAQNPEVIETLKSMSFGNAAVYLTNNVKPQAVSKLTNNAPPPADTLGGGGAPPSQRGPSGATFT